jgi:hypothetical protein
MTIKSSNQYGLDLIDLWISEKHSIEVVEIGVWRGLNCSFCMKRWGDKIKKWNLIDPYNRETYIPYHFDNDRSLDKETARNELDFVKHKIEWIEDYSENVHDLFEDTSVDLVYVDGNHSYSSVLLDATLYWPKLKKGGMMIFDDYNESGVKDAIVNFFKDTEAKHYEPSQTFPSVYFCIKP